MVKKRKGSFYFEIDEQGNKIEPKETFRGSICRFAGCTELVATGYLYCPVHSQVHQQKVKQRHSWLDTTYTLSNAGINKN